MSSADGIEPQRSEEYSKLLEELKQAFVSAANVAVKLYEQGKKDGLSNEAIRKDIETTFDGTVKERERRAQNMQGARLREILPADLKRSYTHALTFDSALRKADVGSNKLQRKYKSNKVLTPQQSVALIVSIIIIIIAFGGLGLVYVNNVFGSTEFLTYENPDYQVRIDYPTTWKTEEINLLPHEVVRIVPNDFLAEYEHQPVGFHIAVGSAADLSQSIEEFEGLTKNSSGSRFINSTNSTLSGLPAYSISYYDYTEDHNWKVIDTMTVLDNELFHLEYFAEPGYFNQYLPDAKRMIDSFKITKVSQNATAETEVTTNDTSSLPLTTESTQSEQELARRDLAYEYGKCVFYDRIPLEQCNAMEPEGLKFYEIYYGNGSWTVQADPVP